MDGSPRKVVRIDAGVASVTPEPPLPDGVRVACQTEGRWILDGRRNLQEALNRSIEFYPSESTSSIRLVGAASAEQAQIIGPGGWDLGRLRLWLDGASGFAVGETIPNLPAGEYTVNWKGRTHTLRTRSHRVVEVEVDSL